MGQTGAAGGLTSVAGSQPLIASTPPTHPHGRLVLRPLQLGVVHVLLIIRLAGGGLGTLGEQAARLAHLAGGGDRGDRGWEGYRQDGRVRMELQAGSAASSVPHATHRTLHTDTQTVLPPPCCHTSTQVHGCTLDCPSLTHTNTHTHTYTHMYTYTTPHTPQPQHRGFNHTKLCNNDDDDTPQPWKQCGPLVSGISLLRPHPPTPTSHRAPIPRPHLLGCPLLQGCASRQAAPRTHRGLQERRCGEQSNRCAHNHMHGHIHSCT